MAENLSQSVAELARQVALDQIAQDIDNSGKFAKKEDINVLTELFQHLLALESRVTALIRVAWVQEKVEPLSLDVVSSIDTNAINVRLTALEQKVKELEQQIWKTEHL